MSRDIINDYHFRLCQVKSILYETMPTPKPVNVQVSFKHLTIPSQWVFYFQLSCKFKV